MISTILLMLIVSLWIINLGIIVKWVISARPRPVVLSLYAIGFCAIAGFLWVSSQTLLSYMIISAVLLAPAARFSAIQVRGESASRRMKFFLVVTSVLSAGLLFLMVMANLLCRVIGTD